MAFAYVYFLPVLQLGAPSSLICPHLFRAWGPSEPSEHRRDSSMPLKHIRTCIQVQCLHFTTLRIR